MGHTPEKAGVAHMREAGHGEWEEVGSRSDSADLSIPFTVTMEWGWNRALPPTGQACVTSKNIPQQ